MVPLRNGESKGTNGSLPSLDNLREEDLSELLDSLVQSKEKRRQIWDAEIKQMGIVPAKKGDEGDDDYDNDEVSTGETNPLTGLKSILVASISPKPSTSYQTHSQSGTSTPSQSSATLQSGSRTPLDGPVSIQMIYQAAFCFWLFSFDDEIARELNNKFDIIPVLADVARNAVKEKIVRVIVATFRNLVEKAPNANVSAMLGCKCLSLMESLSARKWSDEEITQDIDIVKEVLGDKLKGMR